MGKESILGMNMAIESNKKGKRTESDNGLRLFYLYRLLEQHTDEDHPLTTN